jgi:light-regulated signal transduction histidine kinase (bacteriophytochrome)
MRRKDNGKMIFIACNTSPIMNEAGEMARIIFTFRDITERREAEEKISNLNIDLEQRVTQRTAQLEQANKELEAFSYSVSHDLRAPLRAVSGFSQAVIEDYGPQLPEEGRRSLARIQEGATKMGTLVDDLLSLSRLGRAPLNKRLMDMGRLVRGVVEDLNNEQEGRQIDLRIGNLPPGEGDPPLLKQVWINLVSNALKYTRKSAPAIIEIGCESRPEGNVYFIRDNGAGFDMRYVSKLFGVFQRLHRAEDYEGTGVGLAIVQRIIQRHRGRIWADAKVDHGATFYFTLEGGNKP